VLAQPRPTIAGALLGDFGGQEPVAPSRHLPAPHDHPGEPRRTAGPGQAGAVEGDASSRKPRRPAGALQRAWPRRVRSTGGGSLIGGPPCRVRIDELGAHWRRDGSRPGTNRCPILPDGDSPADLGERSLSVAGHPRSGSRADSTSPGGWPETTLFLRFRQQPFPCPTFSDRPPRPVRWRRGPTAGEQRHWLTPKARESLPGVLDQRPPRPVGQDQPTPRRPTTMGAARHAWKASGSHAVAQVIRIPSVEASNRSRPVGTTSDPLVHARGRGPVEPPAQVPMTRRRARERGPCPSAALGVYVFLGWPRGRSLVGSRGRRPSGQSRRGPADSTRRHSNRQGRPRPASLMQAAAGPFTARPSQ